MKSGGKFAKLAVAALAMMGMASGVALAQSVKPVMGKYGCTASHYRGGTYEYTMRGSIVLSADGKYSYLGFKQPSNGTYTVDAKGNLAFKGGYLDAGEATKIDRPNKFFVVFPTNPDNRWTCGLADK
jgi:hypothetical protein